MEVKMWMVLLAEGIWIGCFISAYILYKKADRKQKEAGMKLRNEIERSIKLRKELVDNFSEN